MTKNYLNKEGKCIAQDCYFCGRRVELNKPHEIIIGPICYVSHKKCNKLRLIKKGLKKKKWMIVFKKKNAILLHLNEELPQYNRLKRIDTKKLMGLLK